MQALRAKSKAPPLKNVKDGAPQVQLQSPSLEALRLGKNDTDCDASEFPGPGALNNAPE
jgi:hypothetical protein